MRREWLAIAVLLGAAIPGVALAQAAAGDDSVLVAVERDVEVAADDRVGTLVVVSGGAVVAGRAGTVVVVDGTLEVTGTVTETVVAVETDVTLGETAVVRGDVVVPGGELRRASGATVDGSVRRDVDLQFGWVLGLLSVLFWIAITVTLLIVGLVLVAIARRQVRGAGDLLTDAPGPAVIATIILAIGLPLLAVAAILTVLGLPFGLGLLLLLLPAIWIGGYVVAGERLGRAVLSARRATDAGVSPYLAVVVGLLILQLVGLIPWLGALVVLLAATYGAGGLALFAWGAWRRPEAAA